MAVNTGLKVWRGAPSNNNYVWSPFVTKVEARLRFAGVHYEPAVGSPKSAPKGKIPYITLEDGNQIGDSAFIIKRLVKDGVLPDLNETLSPAQRAQDLAIRALLEEKLYFYAGKEKWIDNYTTMRDGVLAAIPWPVRNVVGTLAHSNMVRTLYGQGTGRYEDDELTALKVEGWKAVNAILGEASRTKKMEGPFWVLGGEEPTEVDATMFGFVVGALICDAAPETMKIAKSYPSVIEYAERIHDRYFPDYERWTDGV